MIVNFLDVFVELGARLRPELLDLLEAAALDKPLASLHVVGQRLGELLHDVFEDVLWRQLQERFQSRQLRTDLNQTLESFLSLEFQVI